MLYEGAILALENAKAHAREKNHEGRAKQLIRATDIVSELLACLDTERGGTVASSLASLYNFILRRIMDANITNDPAVIDECLSVMKTLLEGWREIVERPSGNRSATPIRPEVSMAGITA
jgi:flagellar protein FliS